MDDTKHQEVGEWLFVVTFFTVIGIPFLSAVCVGVFTALAALGYPEHAIKMASNFGLLDWAYAYVNALGYPEWLNVQK